MSTARHIVLRNAPVQSSFETAWHVALNCDIAVLSPRIFLLGIAIYDLILLSCRGPELLGIYCFAL